MNFLLIQTLFMQLTESFLGDMRVQIALLIIVATAHGYGAAWLAVRMLFRPRKPVKLFGFTIFPQGMIPRNRDRLAEAIGKVVGEELVSQDTIIEQLFEKDFLRKRIQAVVDSYAENFLSQDYPSLIEALPANMREPVLDAISSLQLKIAAHIQSVLKSEETSESINHFVERRVDDFLSQRVSQVVNEEQFSKILEFLETRVRSALKQPVLEKKIADFVNRRVEDLTNTETLVGEMFTPESIALLKEKAFEQIQPITHQLTEIIAAERTRNQISALIKREVHNYYENLPFFKKMFVSRENLLQEVDDLVNESLPRRIEETLRGDFFAGEAKTFLDTAIENALKSPIPQILGNINPEQLNGMKVQITRSAVKLLQSEEMQHSVSAYLTDTLHTIRPHSLDAIMQIVHPESEEKLKKMLSKSLLNILNQDETAKIINSVLSRQIDRLLAAPIGKLSEHISEDKIRSAGKSLTDTIIAAAREKLPQAIKEFDIGSVVREKINNYPAEKLEALVMTVAKEHLRTIEFFGALFGLIIGIVQGLMHWRFPK